eukprot:5396752-Pleurochrysis_carterae.AAC.1
MAAGVVRYSSKQDDANGVTSTSPWSEAFDEARKAAATHAETHADDVALSRIRQRYGESSERLIAMLLTFDSLLDFRKVMRLRFDSNDPSERERHALLFAEKRAACSAPCANRIFWQQFERVTVGRHKSQYPHAVQYKAVLQMLEIGDLWNFSLGALESYHAEVGRVADRTGCKRIAADAEDARTRQTRPLATKEGPARVIEIQSSTTMCSSIANRLVAARALNQDEELAIPMRTHTRIALAPERGGGRATAARSAPKLDQIDVEPDATCITEFAKLIA